MFVVCGFSRVGPTNVTARHPLFEKLIWNAQAEALLGVQSDRAVAQILGVHRATVGSHRRALGIAPFRTPKVRHRRTCIICGEQFTIVGGRHDQLRRTCPPPKKCQAKLVKKQLALASPANRLKRVSNLMGLHFLTDKD